jgi:hypothetical protein
MTTDITSHESLIPMTQKEPDSDLSNLYMDIMSNCSIKSVFFIVIIFIIISTSVFKTTILERIDGTTSMGLVTDKGICIQAMFMAIAMLFLNICINYKLL